MNLGSHPVDYLYSLFGLPKRVYCQMENAYFEEYKAFGTEDIATLFCEYEGFSATITTGRNKASESDMACSALDVTCEGNWIHLQGNTYQVNGEEIEIPAPVFSGNEGCIQHLVDCITNDLEPITGVNNGLAVAEITTAGYQSASTGEFVSLPLKDENHPMIAADEQIIDELLD